MTRTAPLAVPDPLYDPFESLATAPADALLGLIAQYRADPRAGKIDLGVGVFRDDAGATPVMRAVKKAEAVLLRDQDSKAYLGPEGDRRFVDLVAEIALGHDLVGSDRLVGLQTPGGTGALRLGAELLKRARPDAVVWIGAPTWPNHEPIFREAGLAVAMHRFYNAATASVDLEAMLSDLETARPGDILLLHGCCHNPSGAVLRQAEWDAIAALCERQRLIPFIDLAYHGLGEGLDADAAATRRFLTAFPTALLAYSCAKNFGLYRDRVGILWGHAINSASATLLRSNMLALARGLWSMPPDHGAAIVRIILDDDELHRLWLNELHTMRLRVNNLREAVAEAHPRLAFVGRQRGMFAMLPIPAGAVATIRERDGIYMAGNGRINIAGLTHERLPDFVASVAPHL